MIRTFSDGHPKVLPACNFLSQYYFYNIFLQKSCRFSLQTLTKFEAAKTGSGVGFLRLTAVWGTCALSTYKESPRKLKPRFGLRVNCGRHVARLHHRRRRRRRRRRAYAPTSNTASHDTHEKISSWVPFSFLIWVWGSAWRPSAAGAPLQTTRTLTS